MLWDRKVHYFMQKSLPLVCILSQTDPVHALRSHFFKNHFKCFHPCLVVQVSFRFSNQNPVCISVFLYTCNLLGPSHPFLFYHPSNIWWGIEILKVLNLQFAPASHYILFHLGQNVSLVFSFQKPLPNSRQNYSCLYLKLYNFRHQTGRQSSWTK